MNKLSDGIHYLWWGLGGFFLFLGYHLIEIVKILKGAC